MNLNKKLNIIIADSNDLIRVGLRSVFSVQDSIDIIAEARSATELMEQLTCFEVDIVLIDYASDNFGISCLPAIIEKGNVQIVAITSDLNAQSLVNALKAGVRSCVKKDCDLTEIVDAVRETAKGSAFFCGEIVDTIQRANIDVSTIELGYFSCEPVVLTDRELEITKNIAEGLTNQEIAENLFISLHTVNTHRKNILSKLGVKNTAGIVLYAVKMNLVSPNKFLFAGE